MATLDVLIPHFCNPAGLERSVASVLAQTWTGDYRLVVVDDASPSSDFARIETFLAEIDVPCIVLRNAVNRGRPFTRNRLLDQVDADFVAWLDAGDTWHPKKLTLQFNHLNQMRLKNSPCSEFWISCNYEWIWENGRLRTYRQEVEADQIRELFMGTRLRAYLWTILAPASTFRQIGWFDESLPRLQDLDYFLRFVIAGGKITKPETKRFLCRYYKSDSGRNGEEIFKCNQIILRKYEPFLLHYGNKFVRMRRFNAAMLGMRVARNNRHAGQISKFVARTFWTHPFLAVSRLASGTYAP